MEINYLESDNIQDIETEKLVIEFRNSSDSDSEQSLVNADHNSSSES